MPIAPYIMDRRANNTDCEGYFCVEAREPYTIRVADQFYFDGRYVDSIWKAVHRLPVQPRRGYRYSDVNFMLIQRMIEEKTGTSLDELVEREFYGPLGLRHTAFNPSGRFDPARIAPTQNDLRWRHQLLHGSVHDETAALMGGVGGNAGLFSSAEDLAVLFQMLLNGGQYGGREYLKPATIELFTSDGHGNHRGLGFDKPYRTNQTSRAAGAPAESYGHTGFTGAAVWVDPTEDLVFVFLSNRVHPNARNSLLFRLNVRSRIHQVVYDALGTYAETIPELEASTGS
jgi:CubicO group peptidase (beta-lactamase class C family)